MNKRIFEPLSNYDLSDFSKEMNNKPANIEMYKDIKKMKTIKELFKTFNHCIIFLENADKKNPVGHWITVFYNRQNPKEVNFFDSYGGSIKQLCPKLIPLLAQAFKKININRIHYQDFGDDSATCGRHCIFNVGLNNLLENHNFDILKEIMDYLKNKYNLKTYNQVVAKFIDINL